MAEFNHPVAKRVGGKSGQAVVEPWTPLPGPMFGQFMLPHLDLQMVHDHPVGPLTQR